MDHEFQDQASGKDPKSSLAARTDLLRTAFAKSPQAVVGALAVLLLLVMLTLSSWVNGVLNTGKSALKALEERPAGSFGVERAQHREAFFSPHNKAEQADHQELSDQSIDHITQASGALKVLQERLEDLRLQASRLGYPTAFANNQLSPEESQALVQILVEQEKLENKILEHKLNALNRALNP